jgi:hypothetical protein
MEKSRTARDNLCQDGLGFFPKRIIGCLIAVCHELEWLLELPLEVQRQEDWNLIASESVQHAVVNWEEIYEGGIAIHAHILRQHLESIFAEGV